MSNIIVVIQYWHNSDKPSPITRLNTQLVVLVAGGRGTQKPDTIYSFPLPHHPENVSLWFPENCSFSNHGSDNIRIHVRSRPPILEIAFPIFLRVPPNSYGRSTVCHSLSSLSSQPVKQNKSMQMQTRCIISSSMLIYPYEPLDVCCFMSPSETALVAIPISSNVFLVPQPKLFNCLFDNFISSIASHGLGAEASHPIKTLSKMTMNENKSKHNISSATCSLCEHQPHSSRPGHTHIPSNSNEAKTIPILSQRNNRKFGYLF